MASPLVEKNVANDVNGERATNASYGPPERTASTSIRSSFEFVTDSSVVFGPVGFDEWNLLADCFSGEGFGVAVDEVADVLDVSAGAVEFGPGMVEPAALGERDVVDVQDVYLDPVSLRQGASGDFCSDEFSISGLDDDHVCLDFAYLGKLFQESRKAVDVSEVARLCHLDDGGCITLWCDLPVYGIRGSRFGPVEEPVESLFYAGMQGGAHGLFSFEAAYD